MILIVYIFICIMYGSSNTASQNDYFKGGSSLTDAQIPGVQLSEEPYLQRRFSSNSKYNGMSPKFFPVIDKGNRFIYSKALRSPHDQVYMPENLGKNKISSRIKKRISKNARRNSKTNSRAVLDDTESIINLFNKSGPPLEYFKRTFQVSVDSKEDSPELSRTKNLEKWRKKNLSHRTRMKNKGLFFKKSSQNFLKRPDKNKNSFIQKSKKRSIGLQSRKSALPLDTKYFRSNSKCQPLESLNLFQNVKFGKLFDSDAYKKCLLLHKANKVELLIENKEISSKILSDAFQGDLFSVFKVMDKLPGTILYESEDPDERINLSNNIQMPFESLKNSNFLNAETEDDNFLPIDPNKLPVLESTAEEVEPPSKDEDVANMYMFPNNIIDSNNFVHEGPKIEHRINGYFPVDQMPIKQNLYENFPSIQPVNSPTIKDNQNYAQIESKKTLSKITFPINDTTAKELFDASIKNFRPTPISQSENRFAITSSNYVKIPEKQFFRIGINNVPVLSPAGFERTEFPNNQAQEEQVLKEIIKDLYYPSQTTSTNTGPLEIENKIKQPEDKFSAEKRLNILPTQIHTSSLKSEPLETVTQATQTESLMNQTRASVLFTANTRDIHIVITEPMVTQTIPEAITANILKENTESDYNIKNPPVHLIATEEMPESDIKMLKMHYRHPHGTKEPEIRHRRQYFHHQ